MKYLFRKKNANVIGGLVCLMAMLNAIPVLSADTSINREGQLPPISQQLECSIFDDDPLPHQDSTKEQSLTLSNSKKRQVNAQCRIKPELAEQLWLQNKAMFVDVRSKSEFDDFRIPNSINLPMHAVKNKSFLRTKPVVLLNKGYATYELDELCDSLKAAGFPKVMVLDGGIVAWSINGKLEGDLNAIGQLNRISPKEIDMVKAERDFLPVYVGERDEMVESLGVKMFIPASGDKQSRLDSLQKIKSQIRADEKANTSPLVFNKDGSNYSLIKESLKNVEINNALYLIGGLRNYIEYREKQKLILTRMEAGPRKVKPCGG
jgi:rhodanese-related sulfurtransferase